MNRSTLRSEKDFIQQYEKKGFGASYRIDDNKLIENGTTDTYSPDHIHIVAQHRFEGMSNPSDMSILYVIEITEKSKGTILVPYGPTAPTELNEFFNQIPKENISDSKSIL